MAAVRPEAFIKGLRLPLSLGGKEDALEFSATFRKVDVVVVGAEPGQVRVKRDDICRTFRKKGDLADPFHWTS